MADRISMPSISFVVARSEPGHIIGCDNKLPWHLKSDLRNFKKVTTNHVVLMGRKTFDSIGRPLPNRTNIVMTTREVSNRPAYFSDSNVFFAEDKGSALYLADLLSIAKGYQDIFVIGGGIVYEEFKQTFNKIYLTEVYAQNVQGDAYFDYGFDPKDWALESEDLYPASDDDEFPFSIKVLKKRDLKKRERSRFLSTFLTPDQNLKDWELQQIDKIPVRKLTRHGKLQLELPNLDSRIISDD